VEKTLYPTQLIKQLEGLRKSRVITYLTSDQTNSPFNAKMALDLVPYLYGHLKHIGRTERLDLYVYSQGGDTMVPWRIITLVREFCDHLGILIPYKAHSAATLLALGADEIVMGEMGELSPIDPTIGTPFNPKRDDSPQSPPLEISVEDVAGFFNFALERLKITSEDNMIKALQMMVDKLHPLALGGVHRSHALIRIVASNLLSTHMIESNQEPLVTQIVDNLAQKLYYHNYMICRNEARQIGLKISNAPDDLDDAMWDLYGHYKNEMGLGETFDPGQYLGQKIEIEKPIAIIESLGLQSCYKKKLSINTIKNPAGLEELQMKDQNIPWSTEVIILQEN
jgi:hypothetical protein